MKKRRSLYPLLFIALFSLGIFVAVAVTIVVTYLNYAALGDEANIFSFLLSSTTQFASFALVLLMLTLVISRILTEIITRPFKDIDLNHPLTNDSYEEVQPLLKRVDDQRKMLQEQNKLLEDTNIMRREFTGNVSHEMKTPLQVIGGYAELMENDMVPPEDIKKTAKLIRREAETMRDLIDDVLTLSKLDENASLEGDLILLSDTIERVSGRLEQKACSRGQVIRLNLDQKLTIKGSFSLAEQIVYNLVDNAIKYNKDDGVVTVDLFTDGNRAKLVVSDEGPGIPISQRERVFERFYRVDSSRSRQTGGTGLGLAIVKHSVEVLHGRIKIVDNPNSETGSSFVVNLPLA